MFSFKMTESSSSVFSLPNLILFGGLLDADAVCDPVLLLLTLEPMDPDSESESEPDSTRPFEPPHLLLLFDFLGIFSQLFRAK
jgi:hypothetical protein